MQLASEQSGHRRPAWRIHGLASQIVVSTILISLGGLVVVLGVTFVLLHKMIGDSIDSALGRQFAGVSRSINVDAAGKVVVDPSLSEMTDFQFWVYRVVPGPSPSAAQLLASSEGSPPPALEELASVTAPTRSDANGQAYFAGPVSDSHGKAIATVVVAEKLAPYKSGRNTLMIGLATAGLIATLGAGLVTRWTVRRTLRPVRQMTRAANSWSDQDLDTRFEVDGNSDEFADLALTLNRLMDRVAGALHSEQLLTSEVAHELRTPLTVILGTAELALADTSDPALSQSLQRIIEQVHTMNSSVTALVQIARDQDRQKTERVDNCINDLVASFSPRPEVTLGVTIHSGADVLLPRDSLTRALSPLVDNALRFATSQVGVVVRREGERLLISVTDDGPGTEGDPFLGTTGLGLPLSRRIAAGMDGQVNLTQESGPTEITLDVPIPETQKARTD